MSEKMSEFDTQAAPIKNDETPVWDLVINDMKKRDEVGRRKYGVPLQPFNGRDALVDAYEEALDLVVYLKQAIQERKNKVQNKTENNIIYNNNEGFDEIKK